jgi:hypothetical protein
MVKNFFRQSQAVMLFVTWLGTLEEIMKDRKLSNEEISQLVLGLLPILQLYGVNVTPQLTSPVARNIYEKIQSAAAISNVVNTAASSNLSDMIPDRNGENYT